jgi:DNA-binding transcriptional ArsR family regulator
MPNNEQTEMLLLLHNIDDRLKEILEILRLSNSEALEAVKEKALAGSPLRQSICDLADGNRSVGDIAKELNKSLPQISNNIAILQKASLIKEIRKGKEKYYLKTG